MSAVCVLSVINGELVLHEQQLKEIFLHTNGNNKNIVVISITGAIRKGKTTLLNFIKSYLENDWNECKKANKKLNGFLAVQGSDPVTEGIMMWSEPIVKSIKGEEVAIYLMDTEGAHELGSNQSASAAIFALTSLLSSVQLYNSKDGIDQRDFELLVQIGRFAGEVSKASLQNTSYRKSFQKLAIIIRDWISPSDIKYGRTSLQILLSKTSRRFMSNDWVSIWSELEKYYEEIHCHLLPYPGKKIAFCLDGNKSDFHFNEYKGIFIDHIKLLLDDLLSDNIIKIIGNHKLNSLEIFNLFTGYYNVFKNGLVVAPDSILKATAKICYEKAYDVAFNNYKLQIRNFVETCGNSITIERTNEKMNITLVDTQNLFINTITFVQTEVHAEYFHKLSLSIREYNQETLNGIENVISAQRWRRICITGATIGVGGLALSASSIPLETITEISVPIVDAASKAVTTYAVAELTKIINTRRE